MKKKNGPDASRSKYRKSTLINPKQFPTVSLLVEIFYKNGNKKNWKNHLI